MLLSPGRRFAGKTTSSAGSCILSLSQTGTPSISRALLSLGWNRYGKSYQVSDASSLAAGSQHQQPVSLAVPQLHATSSEATVPPSHVDPLEQIALVPPKKSLCLKSITLTLHVPVKNRLHKEERTYRHTALTPPPCLHCKAGHWLSSQGRVGVSLG